MTDLTERLRECPFCGGEAKLVSGASSTVQCQNDQCIIGDAAPFNDFSHRQDAIAAWNKRPTLEAFTQENARLREALEGLQTATGSYIESWLLDELQDPDFCGVGKVQHAAITSMYEAEQDARKALGGGDDAN